MKYIGIALLLFFAACSSFSVKTSTSVVYIDADGSATVSVRTEGNIPGAGVQSEVPITNPNVNIRTQVGGAAGDE